MISTISTCGGIFTGLQSDFSGDARAYGPLALAFLGDGVFELMVRERLLQEGSMPAGKLHSMAVRRVNAAAQSGAYGALLEVLTQEETDILKRGRNASSAKTPKSATVEQYRKATAIEALFGYLYLRGETARLRELFGLIYDQMPADHTEEQPQSFRPGAKG